MTAVCTSPPNLGGRVMQDGTVQQQSGLPIDAKPARLSEQDRSIPYKEEICQRGLQAML